MALLIALSAVLLLATAGVLLYLSSRQSDAGQVDWKARISGDTDASAPVHLEQPGTDPIARWFNHHLQRAGLDVDTSVWQRASAIVLLIALVAGLFGGFAAGVVVLFAELAMAYLWALRREAARRVKTMEQLPDFIEFMMRSLSAGNSLEEALYSATADAEEPARSLFLSVSRQVRLGAPIEDVLEQAAEIHKIQDIRVMAMAARVNRRYGGSLKRIFKSLVQAIRERDAAARELRALTAETRFSAVVLAVVPLLLSVYILMQNPDYYLEMWNQTRGRGLLLFSVVLQATGILVIWRMLHAAEEEG